MILSWTIALSIQILKSFMNSINSALKVAILCCLFAIFSSVSLLPFDNTDSFNHDLFSSFFSTSLDSDLFPLDGYLFYHMSNDFEHS